MVRIYLITSIVIAFISCKAQETKEIKPTASENVEVLSKPFVIKGLDRSRIIRVLIPTNYNETDQRYPVLYMHDGQNLFDAKTSYAGEWKVDEILNDGSNDLIVVGIDNGQGKRMNEMAPWDHEEFGKAEGDEYIDFIVKQVKPFIDSTYRTLDSRENTAMMGSSMGGLITHYAMLKYSDTFGKVGIFSPSYWFSDEIFKATASSKLPEDLRMYVIVGSKEGTNMVKPAKQMSKLLIDQGHSSKNLHFEVVRGGQHSEQFWSTEFEDAIEWLMSSNE